ncbi:MAG TPA: VanZ family protein [Ferruginibacter sp.]|nr:VanZ family protein [Ferruginibacter sp.]HMP19792.1 VanZ family protein [Ferruginibacter sp.]
MTSYKNTAAAKPGCWRFIPAAVWFVLVLIAVFFPVPEGDGGGWFDIENFDKLIHAVMFGGLVFLTCWPYKNVAIPVGEKTNLFIRIMLATIVWGLTTELIQKYFIPGRQYDLLDWLADAAGAIIAFAICRRLFAKA